MKTLSLEQKEFIREYFFNTDNYELWSDVANALLEIGTCVVPSMPTIWVGGIGNFIKITNTCNCVGCECYSFNLELFLESAFFNEYRNQYLDQLKEEKELLIKKIEEISLL